MVASPSSFPAIMWVMTHRHEGNIQLLPCYTVFCQRCDWICFICSRTMWTNQDDIINHFLPDVFFFKYSPLELVPNLNQTQGLTQLPGPFIPTSAPQLPQRHQARSHISNAFDELHVAAEARCAELLEHLQENSLLEWDLQKSFRSKSSKISWEG